MHRGKYRQGKPNFQETCILTIPHPGVEESGTEQVRLAYLLEPGEHKGKLQENLQWLPNGKSKKAHQFAPQLKQLDPDGMLTRVG